MPSQKTEYVQVGEFVRIFQRGGRWHANFQHNGKQCRQSLKTTSMKQARLKALAIERELVAGDYKPMARAPAVSEVVAQYMAYLKSEGRADKTKTKYAKVFERLLDLMCREGRRSILGVDLPLLDKYRSERAAVETAPKTIYCESVIIRQLVNFAKSRRLIRVDPLAGVKIPEPKPAPQPCWSPAQVEQILAASKGPQQLAFMFLADTGLRIGELIWLTWDDIDWQRNVILVRPKEGWKSKTGDQRAVPMNPRVVDCLGHLARHACWVLTATPTTKHPSNDRQMSERRLLQSLKRVLIKLGLPGHLHTFRHSFISAALAAGTPESQVRAWVGHVDEQTIKLYTHIADKQSQAAMQKLASSNGSVSHPNHKEVDHVAQSKTEKKAAQNQHNPGESTDGLDAK